MDWYAFICTVDRADYKVGDVCSWASDPLTEEELSERGLEMVYVGKYEEIDFDNTIFDPALKQFVPRPPEE